MNLQENIDRIKEVMGLISELDIKRKTAIEGYKNVYFSNTNPNIVIKFGDYGTINGEAELFSIPIGDVKKSTETKTDVNIKGETYTQNLYYCMFEKLDTEKYMSFYRNMEDTFENYASDEIKKKAEEWGWIKTMPDGWGTNDYFDFCILNISSDPNKRDAVKLFNTMIPIVKKENSNYYNDYLQFIDLLYKITTLKEYDGDWDFNNGNFGYDKNGKIKSLDI